MAWPLLAAVAAAAAPVPETTAPEPVPDIEIIELEQERYRRMTVPVTIGGEGPFRFMLDTGAQATVVSRDLAERLALFDRSPATLVGMASTRQVETTVIDDVTALPEELPQLYHALDVHIAAGWRRPPRPVGG